MPPLCPAPAYWSGFLGAGFSDSFFFGACTFFGASSLFSGSTFRRGVPSPRGSSRTLSACAGRTCVAGAGGRACS
jgi:hypothetical protein